MEQSKLIDTLETYQAAEKQIMAARADEVAMAAIRADPQIFEEHLAFDAAVVASRADAAMRLAALNDSSWRFLEATVGAFEEDYKVFYQRACAYLILRASRLVLGAAQATTTTTSAPTMWRLCPLPCSRSQSSSISLMMRSSLSY